MQRVIPISSFLLAVLLIKAGDASGQTDNTPGSDSSRVYWMEQTIHPGLAKRLWMKDELVLSVSYDTAGRVIQETNLQEGSNVLTTYDSLGRPATRVISFPASTA